MGRAREPLSARLLPWLLLTGLAATATAIRSYVGDSCKMKDGSEGACRAIEQCKEAEKEFGTGEFPVICSYDQYKPIVCCPFPTAATAGAKATEMCKKYAEAVYVWEQAPLLLVTPEFVKVDSCATRAVPFIVGGNEAKPNEFPHMALLGFDSRKEPKWRCGGSLISEYYVITAATCVHTPLGPPLVVRLGELNLNLDREPFNQHVDYGVAEHLSYPDFNPRAQYNDVGLLKLDRKVNFTRSIRPACLNIQPEDLDKTATATGWGRTETRMPDKLMKVRLQLYPSEECVRTYGALTSSPRFRKGFLGGSMICAGDLAGGKDTCQGDSGGPLQTKLDNPYCMYNIIGITNFGLKNCGAKGSPAVYARVSRFLPWIVSVVWPNEG